MKLSGSQRLNDQPLWEDPDALKKLQGIVARLATRETEREDLFQEAWVHLWQVERHRPDQTKSWYLKNCEFYLRHLLEKGRSIDSAKRGPKVIQLSLEGNAQNGGLNDALLRDLNLIHEIHANDMVETMHRILEPPEKAVFDLLSKEFGTREIARSLDVSHVTVIERRRRIVASARRLFGSRGYE
jgi:DNA-directed RNA polymerase specialized sigma24 family protein